MQPTVRTNRCFRCGGALYRSGRCDNPECIPHFIGGVVTKEVPVDSTVGRGVPRPKTHVMPRVPPSIREPEDIGPSVVESGEMLRADRELMEGITRPDSPLDLETLREASVRISHIPRANVPRRALQLRRRSIKALRGARLAAVRARRSAERWRRVAVVFGCSTVLSLALALVLVIGA